MNAKNVVILLIIAAVAGTAGWVVKKNQNQKLDNAGSSLGQRLYEDFSVNDVKKIIIETKENKVELTKSEDYWVVANQYSYYADFVKIADFLKKIPELKSMQNIDIEKDDLGRLELNDPGSESQTGTLVQFLDKDDKTLGELLLGKEHMRKARATASPFGGGGEWPDGRYVLRAGKGKVVLVSESFSNIVSNDSAWIDKSFIRAGKVKKAYAEADGNNLWTVSRENKLGSLEFEGNLEDNQEIVTSKLNDIDNALSYSNFNKISDPEINDETLGFTKGRKFTAKTFDGITYTAAIGDKTEEGDYPVKFTITYQEPPPEPAKEDESEEDRIKREDEFKKTLAEAKKKYGDESSRYTQWVYLMPSYTVEKMIVDRNDLLKEKEKDTEKSTDGGQPTPPPVSLDNPSPPAIPAKIPQ